MRNTSSSCILEPPALKMCARPPGGERRRFYESNHRRHREGTAKERRRSFRSATVSMCTPAWSRGIRNGSRFFRDCDWPQRPRSERNVYGAPDFLWRRCRARFSECIRRASPRSKSKSRQSPPGKAELSPHPQRQGSDGRSRVTSRVKS